MPDNSSFLVLLLAPLVHLAQDPTPNSKVHFTELGLEAL